MVNGSDVVQQEQKARLVNCSYMDYVSKSEETMTLNKKSTKDAQNSFQFMEFFVGGGGDERRTSFPCS